jgi:general secretion pathway protein K
MISASEAKRPRSGRDGFIVVAVLWILAALAALVSIYALFVTNTAVAVSASSDGLVADPLVSAGVELAVYRILGAQGSAQPTPGSAQGSKQSATGQFTARVGAARLVVVIKSEAARIDLNKASKALLSSLFVTLGAAPFDVGGYADRIIAWRATSITGQAGSIDTDSEDSLYRSAGLNYMPRHAPFVHVSELWRVVGIPPVFIGRMLPYVTVYSGLAKVDVAQAAPQVIAAVQNQDGALAQPGLGGAAGPGGTEPDAEPPPNAGKAFRVDVQVDFDNGRRAAAETVILISNDGGNPYRVLSWQNALDGTADQPRDFGQR